MTVPILFHTLNLLNLNLGLRLSATIGTYITLLTSQMNFLRVDVNWVRVCELSVGVLVARGVGVLEGAGITIDEIVPVLLWFVVVEAAALLRETERFFVDSWCCRLYWLLDFQFLFQLIVLSVQLINDFPQLCTVLFLLSFVWTSHWLIPLIWTSPWFFPLICASSRFLSFIQSSSLLFPFIRASWS